MSHFRTRMGAVLCWPSSFETRLYQARRTRADSPSVWSQSFADVLDDALGGDAGAASMRTPPVGFTYQPASPFLFFKLPALTGARSAYASAPQEKRTAPALTVPPVANRPERVRPVARPRRFDARRALTAHLGPDFTVAELKRAYHRLARRIHPDRYPHLDEAARARLSREFADLSVQFRELLSAAAPLN